MITPPCSRQNKVLAITGDSDMYICIALGNVVELEQQLELGFTIYSLGTGTKSNSTGLEN